MLNIEKLSLSIGNTLICQDLDIEFHKGEHWCVLGRNGAGKTTLLYAIAGIHTVDKGRILLDNVPVGSMDPVKRARRIAVLLQDQHYDFPVTAEEYCLLARAPYHHAWQHPDNDDQAIIKKYLDMLDLDEFRLRNMQQLSGGERRRIEIAATLIQDTTARLFDEPANHLDLAHQQQVMKHIRNEMTDRLTISVMHDLNLASRFCTHAILLFGEGRAQTTRIESLDADMLSDLYHTPVRKIIDQDHSVFIVD